MNEALLIVDVQYGFLNEHTKHIPKLDNKPVSFYRDLLDWHKFGKDTQEFKLAFEPRSEATIIDKPIYSCVTPNFLKLLTSKEIRRIDVCGIETDICVCKCAVDLFEAGIIPRVLSKYSASCTGNDSHIQALETLKKFIGERQVL